MNNKTKTKTTTRTIPVHQSMKTMNRINQKSLNKMIDGVIELYSEMFDENIKEMTKRGVSKKNVEELKMYCKGATDGMNMIKCQFVDGVLSMN